MINNSAESMMGKKQSPLNEIFFATMISRLTIKNSDKNSLPCSNYRYDEFGRSFIQVYFGKVDKIGLKAILLI